MPIRLSRRHLIAFAPAAAIPGAALSPAGPGEAGRVLAAGVHRFDRSTTIAADLRLDPGARIFVARGATLTLLGSFAAPVAHIFTGPGTIDLSRARLLEAYPEWWGAIPEDTGADSAPAIQACLAAHPAMRLGPHSYYCSRTIAVEQSSRRIVGSGQRWLGPGQGTRIVLTGTGDVMRLGTLRRPGGINDFVQGVVISDLQLTRTQPAAGDGLDAAAGLRCQFILFCDISRVDSAESVNGFVASGTVRTYFRDCSAFRSPAGGNRSKIFRGYVCDGNADIGLAGGNGSVYFVDCNARTGGRLDLADNVGMLLDGPFADTYLANFETSAIATGIRLAGNASAQGRGRQRSGYADTRIVAPVLDQCTAVGIEITDTSDHALIDISDAYVASAPGSRATMLLNQSRGLVTIRGGQLLGWFAAERGSFPIGLDAADSDGLDLSGLKLLGFREPTRMTRCRDLRLAAAVNQPDRRSPSPAVQLTDCAEALVAVSVKGREGAYAAGVQVSGGQSRSLAIETAVISAPAVGGEQRRVVLDGAAPDQVSVRR